MEYYAFILKNYNSMSSALSAMEKGVVHNARTSYADVGFCGGDTERQVEALLTKIQRKNDLEGLKKLTATTLNELERDERAVLYLFYIRKVPALSLSKRLGVSKRTFYRRLKAAKRCFAERLIARGYDCDWFLSNYGDESFNVTRR